MLRIVKVRQNTCPACDLLQIMLDNGVDFPVEELNLDDFGQEERRQIIDDNSIMGTPVLLFMKDGKEVDRLSGIRDVTPDIINDLIKKYEEE